MGGTERVRRQHDSGRLTVRERIERLFDPGSFRETGALAGRATYGASGGLEEASCRPTRSSVRAASTDAAPWCRVTTSPSAAAPPAAIWQKAIHAERLALTCACRWCAWWTARAAVAASRRSSRWGSPTCPRSRASSSWYATSRSCPSSPGRSAQSPAWGGARRLLALLGHRSRHGAAVRCRPTRGRGSNGRGAGQGAARRRPDPGPRGRRRQRRRRRGGRARTAQALSPTSPNVWEAPPIVAASDPPDRREQGLLSIVPRDRRRPAKMRAILAAVLDRGSPSSWARPSADR